MSAIDPVDFKSQFGHDFLTQEGQFTQDKLNEIIAVVNALTRDITESDRPPATPEVAVKPSNSPKKEDNQ